MLDLLMNGGPEGKEGMLARLTMTRSSLMNITALEISNLSHQTRMEQLRAEQQRRNVQSVADGRAGWLNDFPYTAGQLDDFIDETLLQAELEGVRERDAQDGSLKLEIDDYSVFIETNQQRGMVNSLFILCRNTRTHTAYMGTIHRKHAGNCCKLCSCAI